MIYHIVMWKFKPEIKNDKKETLKVHMEENLKSLVGKVPGLLSVDFEKADDIGVYSTHPAHVHVADTYIRPYVTDRACLDYEA